MNFENYNLPFNNLKNITGSLYSMNRAIMGLNNIS